MGRARTQLVGLAACAWLSQGCSLTFSDIDDYEQGSADAGQAQADAATDAGGERLPPSCGDGRSLCVELIRFSPHINEGLELTLAAGGVVRGRAVMDPFVIEKPEARDNAGVTLIGMANALEGTDQPHELRFFADHDPMHDGRYTPPPSDEPGAPFPDHSWVEPVPEDGLLSFEHATNFVDLTKEPPRELEGDFRMTFRGFTSHPGSTLYLWVILQREVPRTVGYYRLNEIPEQLCSPDEGASCTEAMQNPFTVQIPGILDDGETYHVEFLVDRENLGVFDAPPTDHSWRLQFEADRNGIDEEFVHTADFVPISPVPMLQEAAP